ncbi:MAG TPA: nucleotidyltransferase domain-containing protein [Spirochaetota bacterium]|nr:nucleotidyltransferase domain-containing protein [Spirochaetota bacterium]
MTLYRQKVLDELAKCKSNMEARYGVRRIGLFGSVARDQAGQASDIDIVVEMDSPDVFAIVHLKEELEANLAVFGANVDIVQYRERMNRFLKERIDHEAMYV